MLGLTKDRLDYGEQLRAPVGYRFDQGIATTYSLDLEALVAASLALNLDQTLEGDLSGERLALLESVDQLQGKLLVFYQRGNVKVPQKFNRLYGLLEPLLVPAVSIEGPKGPYASFHPKVWVLRFAPDDRRLPVRFRLLVLSRNLSFDRSWDIAVAIDGEAVKRGGNTDTRLLDFVRCLGDGSHAAHTDTLCESLANVEWTAPDGFENLAVLPGFATDSDTTGSSPIDLDGRIDELLVLSPFVDAGPDSLLQDLAQRTRGAKTLISRSDTLDAIGPELLAGWDVRSLSDLVVDGEERSADDGPPQSQELHAKLIVAKIGAKAVWHVGSANMTNAAFGKPAQDVTPRNRELMLRMEGRNSKAGPVRLLEQWTSSGAFESHTFRTDAAAQAESEQELRRVIYALTSAPWRLHATQTNDDVFSVALTLSHLPVLPPGYKVAVGLLCHPTIKPLAASLTWNEIKLADISAFVLVEVRVAAAGTTQRFSVQAAFEVDLIEARKRAVFKELAGTQEKLLRYLNLLLDANASKAKWLRADNDDPTVSIFGLDAQETLYEQLLKSAARAPNRLRRALDVFARLREAQVELPEGLEETLNGFVSFAEVPDAA